MTESPISFAAIIARWPSPQRLGEDLGLERPHSASVMRFRGWVPPHHWPEMMASARRRGIPLTADELGRAAVAYWAERRPPRDDGAAAGMEAARC